MISGRGPAVHTVENKFPSDNCMMMRIIMLLNCFDMFFSFSRTACCNPTRLVRGWLLLNFVCFDPWHIVRLSDNIVALLLVFRQPPDLSLYQIVVHDIHWFFFHFSFCPEVDCGFLSNFH